ncbi:D-alanine transfer protein-like protein [Chthoniobacter flavus Ellin428]|uniref:D-alanine transfer protein-like protein n=1 Tax=Chthoniobacter flavus Ellin428 TaxID=497964 RepID=B4D735_9BACT|nr:D-alanine transferase [Chthoniobacter flavus]EDY17686.1 D-alanine transfer protein-like protein [Chthoniobacter flavus Ellin428]TCO84101.1 poly-D-alanine transfer protein DltD [Chthoniobacter flavus]
MVENTASAPAPPRTHLRAVLLAMVLLVLLGAVAGVFTSRLEKREIHVVALESSVLKDLSTAWQRAAMAQPDILPFYGSSELTRNFGNEPQRFFASYPTGFGVSPVGRAGCTSLTLAEKIAAASSGTVPQRKVAISLSPSWFFSPQTHARWYAGNFSAAQASALIFHPRLSLELKRDFARRMLDYPDTLEQAPLLSFAVHRLAGSGQWDAMLYRVVTPLARMQSGVADLGDHFAFAWHILHDHERPHAVRTPMRLDWETILLAGGGEIQHDPRFHKERTQQIFFGNRRFAQVLNGSREWGDLELLLRASRELHLDPLLLSIPIDYRYYQSIGVARENLDRYRERLHEIASRHDVALIDFAEHVEDPVFFADHNDHLSARGWLYVDRALDFYFHAAKHQRYFAPVGAGEDHEYP